MSQLSQELRIKAEEIRLSDPHESAVEHLKQAGFSDEDARYSVAQHVMEKEACSALVQSGIDIEQAVSMVKAAGINLKELTSYVQEVEVAHPSIELLKQAADSIEALEEELASSKIEVTALPEQFTKAASNGMFTNEDLIELQNISPGVMTKIASAMDEQPWGMGSGAGVARPKTDPMLEFILG